ncbi:hypothetical protein [Streptomyces chattanoogensis]|uniref:Integral membrane protein n=1 Tax=Streptomyces chattanoogensis TaxID=66876 RepID=A0A0N0H3W0_9ACTN|nr:hypothetical protein [Streptomyces chattanoogensis]KPC66592.1 hypothetical protein ADL29_04040 [Streptomyces chattanoogensis]
MTAGSVSRAVRAAIFAVVCVTTAALGHALMSAQPLPWWALVAALGTTGSVAWRSAGRERGGLVVTGATVVAQLGLHSLFGLAQSRPSMPGMNGMAGMADMPAGSAVPVGRMAALHGDTSQLPLMPSGHGALGMFLAHTLAAVVCGLWLWRGEAAAFRLARSVAAVLFAPLLLVLTTLDRTDLKPSARPVAAAGHVVRLSGAFLHHVLSRRGPPRLSLCC